MVDDLVFHERLLLGLLWLCVILCWVRRRVVYLRLRLDEMGLSDAATKA